MNDRGKIPGHACAKMCVLELPGEGRIESLQ